MAAIRNETALSSGSWCNWRRDTALTGNSPADQLVIAGRLTVAPPLNGAMVSCIMYRARWTVTRRYVRAGSRRRGGRCWKFQFAIKAPE